MAHFIGDTHGDCRPLARWNDTHFKSNLFHVGDYGAGFPWMDERSEKLAKAVEARKNRIFVVRGNHDDPSWFDGRTLSNALTFVQDNTVIEAGGLRVLCVGGATSIDRTARCNGVDFWTGEEFAWKGFVAPCDVVVTHSAGSWTGLDSYGAMVLGWSSRDPDLMSDLDDERALHDLFLEKLVNSGNKPRAWFHGHFHERLVKEHHGIPFRGLNINELAEFKP